MTRNASYALNLNERHHSPASTSRCPNARDALLCSSAVFTHHVCTHLHLGHALSVPHVADVSSVTGSDADVSAGHSAFTGT